MDFPNEKVGSYKILLADDNEIFRQGIRNILCQVEDNHICGETDNVHDLLQLVDKLSPHLIIMDIDLPKLDGLGNLIELKKENPQLKILLLTTGKKTKSISFAVDHNLEGLILKNEPSGELLRAVEFIRKGGKFYSALLSSELMDLIKTRKELKPLSSRERKIFGYMAEGIRCQKISELLNISIFTVYRYRQKIREKLHMERMTDLIEYCLLNKNNLWP